MAGTKRKVAASSKAESSKDTKQPKVNGQKAVSRDVNIPIDEGFGNFGAFAYTILFLKTRINRAIHTDTQ